MSSKTVTHHMSVNLIGLLRNYKGKKINIFSDEAGKEMTDLQARAYIEECQAKGWTKIPCGECDGFDYFGGGCPGHNI